MLSAHMMGSNGHQSLPFGYDPTSVHGMGLPPYVNQPALPSGQPLLSEQETEQMQDFFQTFDDGQSHGHTHPMTGPTQFGESMGQRQQAQLPQHYLGSDSYARESAMMEWHPQQMNNFQFGGGIPAGMNHMSNIPTPTSPFGNSHQQLTSPVNHMFPMNQNNLQTFTNGWQQPFPLLDNRSTMHFGSDPNFMNNGYAAPEGQIEPLNILDYAMAPTSSASNTQPNSRPGSNANTEPSSPIATKRRKLNIFQTDSLRMTNSNGFARNGLSVKESPPLPTTLRKSRKSFVKHEQPPTPMSKTPTNDDDEGDEDEDAEYDEDEVEDQPSPPAPWPASKARPAHKPPLPPKPAKPRKKSSIATSASPAKPKVRRTSSVTTANAISRTPLSAEQKKANHTNSEQRRRDATARSYAELYDRVPEIQEIGKQSTMKKLEVVVDKARAVKDRLEYLRALCGKHTVEGLQPNVSHNEYQPSFGGASMAAYGNYH